MESNREEIWVSRCKGVVIKNNNNKMSIGVNKRTGIEYKRMVSSIWYCLEGIFMNLKYVVYTFTLKIFTLFNVYMR